MSGRRVRIAGGSRHRGWEAQDRLQAWRQSATGQFAVRWARPVSPWARFAVDDVTGDGRHDIVLTGVETAEVVAGTDGHTVATVPGAYRPPQRVATGDVNGDGVADIVSIDGYSGAVDISLTWNGAPTALQSMWPVAVRRA